MDRSKIGFSGHLASAGITVVIPTLNREDYLFSAVQELLKDPFRPLEILVVDQSDRPSKLLQDLATRHRETLSYYHETFRGLPIARNFGWQNARHDLILFLDDDIRCEPGLAKEHVKAHADPDIGIVAGSVIEARGNPPHSGKTGRFLPWTATPTGGFDREGNFEVDLAPGGNFSVKRRVFLEVGGVDELLTAGAALYEESDFCLRAKEQGYRLMFHGAARIIHLAASSGGCRTPDVRKYVWSLSRNRCLLIGRHLKPYHYPTAFARLALLGLSYSVSSRDPQVLLSCLKGVSEGWRLLRKGPQFTHFPKERRD